MIRTFAEQHRLKTSREDCGDFVDLLVTGKQGQIYECSDTELGVMFVTDGKKPPRTGLWNRFKAACLGVGMTLRQVGDAEGSFTFNPADPKQAKVAIKGIRARVKRQMTPESLARLASTSFKAKTPAVEALISV